jgi:signal transduction histidine kinase
MSTKDLIPRLEEQLAQIKDPRQRIDLVNQTAWDLYTKDAFGAKQLAEDARRAAKRLNSHPQGLAESLHILSRCEALLDNYAVSISLGLEALEIFEEIGDLAGQGRAYNAMGITYLYMGNYPQALTTLLESLDVFEESEDLEWQARQLNDLGTLYLEIGEPEQALAYLAPGLSLARQNDLTHVRGELLDNACNAYCAVEEYTQALSCGLESINCYRKIGAPRGEAKALNSIGDVYQFQEDYPRALECHNQALEMAESVGYKFEIVEALLRIGRLYHLDGRLQESLGYFERALGVAQEIDARQKIYECHRALAEVYKQLGDFQKALEQFELFQLVERSVFSSRADNRLKSLQVMHQLKDARHQAEISRLRNVELQQQIEEREQLIADLEAFSHMVAHDLRNPLASVMMSIGMVNELKSEALGEDGREFLRIARSMAERMSVIIRELLVLASVRQKDVTLVVVNMGEITQNALDVLSFQIEQAHAKIIVPDEWPQVFGYPAWIEEIWTNYISNALKYGGTPPCIELGYTRQERGRVQFWVRDNGDGIPPEQQEKLFTNFSRLNRTDNLGYGLGLSIVQRIAAKLDGDVGVESSGQPGEGSTFYFTLPGMIEI